MDRRGTSAGAQRRTKATTELGPATKGRRPGADRLSALSDDLLLYILSFLGTRKAVSTSCLSRRWRDLYHDLPSLDFSEGFDNDSAWFIDRLLLLHAAPRIEVFRLSMPIQICSRRVEGEDSSAYRQIDSRLLFAVRRGVRVLDLDIRVDDRDVASSDEGHEARYGVPPWVFQCRTLEDFSVENCDLRLPAHVRLASLKKMSLSLTKFHCDELKRLLRGCPLLQSLRLVHCNRQDDLVIDARACQKLEELVIVDEILEDLYLTVPYTVEMQIYAPSVKYLTLHVDALRQQYEAMDLSSLVVASLQLNVDGGRVLYADEADAFATGILLRIPQVQVLKLCRWSLQALSRSEVRVDLAWALPGVTTLELTVGLQKGEMQAILSALRVCNKLTTLVISILHEIMMPFGNRDSNATESPQLFALDSGIVMQNLKTIVVQGLTRCNYQALGKEGGEAGDFVAHRKKNDIALIGFLLQVSPVLDKLIVQPSKGMDRMARKLELLSNLSSDLLSLPRASPNVKVIIDQK